VARIIFREEERKQLPRLLFLLLFGFTGEDLEFEIMCILKLSVGTGSYKSFINGPYKKEMIDQPQILIVNQVKNSN
jgi:hypothetical protein